MQPECIPNAFRMYMEYIPNAFGMLPECIWNAPWMYSECIPNEMINSHLNTNLEGFGNAFHFGKGMYNILTSERYPPVF